MAPSRFAAAAFAMLPCRRARRYAADIALLPPCFSRCQPRHFGSSRVAEKAHTRRYAMPLLTIRRRHARHASALCRAPATNAMAHPTMVAPDAAVRAKTLTPHAMNRRRLRRFIRCARKRSARQRGLSPCCAPAAAAAMPPAAAFRAVSPRDAAADVRRHFDDAFHAA